MSKLLNPNVEYINNFEEVDLAFAERFRGIVINGREVKVLYYTPDVDITEIGELPVITFYRKTPFLDISRWNNNIEYIDKPVYDSNGNLVAVNKRIFPEPWALIYGMHVTYDLQRDGAHLTGAIMRKVQRDDVIRIKGYPYTIEMENGGLAVSPYKEFGKVTDGRRRFSEKFDFRIDIWKEVDEGRKYKTVQKIHIDPYVLPTKHDKEE